MIENILDLASAVIIPALSLIVAAIGLRNDIRKRRDQLLEDEANRREQFNSEILTERNTRHDEIIKYQMKEIERLRDDLTKIRDEINSLKVECERVKTELSHFKELLQEVRTHSNKSNRLIKSEDGNDGAKI